MSGAVQIVHIDDALLVVNKPAGLLAVPGRGPDKQDCLASRVQARYADALIVHRLDMATSGLMLFARGPLMQRQLSRLFAQRRIHKRYVAVIAGRPAPERGEVALPLIRDWPNRPRQMVDHDRGKPALTRYQLIDFQPLQNTSRIELEPVTGRSHQLRVHMQALGHPILGDSLYADAGSQAMASRLLLHASALSFDHPLTHQPLCLSSEVPF